MSKPKIISVTKDLFCVMRRSYFTCSYILRLPAGLFLIDAGMKSSGEDMLYAVESIGHKITDVRAVMLTHWHNDHSGGAFVVKSLTDARIYYHKDEAKYFTRETAAKGLLSTISDLIPESGPLILFKGLLGSAPARAVTATQLVVDGDIIEEDFLVIGTPGHTEGHICFYYRPQRILFAGDALAAIDGRVRFMARVVTPDLVAARESMKRCLTLPIDIICPGHREPLTINTQAECQAMSQYLANNQDWPLLG